VVLVLVVVLVVVVGGVWVQTPDPLYFGFQSSDGTMHVYNEIKPHGVTRQQAFGPPPYLLSSLPLSPFPSPSLPLSLPLPPSLSPSLAPSPSLPLSLCPSLSFFIAIRRETLRRVVEESQRHPRNYISE
jgi:hypothetical protein